MNFHNYFDPCSRFLLQKSLSPIKCWRLKFRLKTLQYIPYVTHPTWRVCLIFMMAFNKITGNFVWADLSRPSPMYRPSWISRYPPILLNFIKKNVRLVAYSASISTHCHESLDSSVICTRSTYHFWLSRKWCFRQISLDAGPSLSAADATRSMRTSPLCIASHSSLQGKLHLVTFF